MSILMSAKVESSTSRIEHCSNADDAATEERGDGTVESKLCVRIEPRLKMNTAESST
jgi:hypothetical protein